MKRGIGILKALIRLIVLVVIVGCGGTQTTPATSTSLAIPTPTSETNGAKSIVELDVGSKRISDKDGMTLLYVPAGEFTMGSNDGGNEEKPVHTVNVDGFYIDQTEVTNAMYATCVEIGGCRVPSSAGFRTPNTYYGNRQYDNYPVTDVSWADATAYCEWAGRRLPTEAEWEKAARGTDGRVYPWGNQPHDETRYHREGDPRLKPEAATGQVGAHPTGASPYGALNMIDNVAEWVADWYDKDYYSISPIRNPAGPTSGDFRVIRGGAWYYAVAFVTASNRFYDFPDRRYPLIGFRCAR